jgi:hypothetical protein
MASSRNVPSLLAQWRNLVVETAGLCMSSQEVVARRFWMLGTQSQQNPAASMRELRQMSNEKVRATFDSASAMGFAAMAVGMKFLAGMALPGSARRGSRVAADVAHAGAGIVRAGMVPVRRKVSANAARLRRK